MAASSNSVRSKQHGIQKQRNKKMCRGTINLRGSSGNSIQQITTNGNSSQADLGQSVLRGYKRRVKGSNGRATAQLSRPRVPTQTLSSEQNRMQYPCLGGHAVIKAWRIAYIPRVDPREGRTRLPSEKGYALNAIMDGRPQLKRQRQEAAEYHGTLQQPLGRLEKRSSIKAECRAISPHQSRKSKAVTPEERGTTTTTTADKGCNCSFPPARRQPEELYCN